MHMCEAPLEGDEKKLFRVFGYPEGMKGYVMMLKQRGFFAVKAYIKTNFSAHPDGKSHSCICDCVRQGASLFLIKKVEVCEQWRQIWWY